jgi:alkanesulfonate monooxygenase SsuD/methylene tetrahydromethanopterin reductase-like flavin-dependent oxidoreductase (luciferase family)
VVDYCEGWFPRSRNPALVTQGMAELKDRAAKAGRDMQSISISVFGVPGDQKLLDTYRDLGVTRVILRLPSESRETILPQLDRFAKFLS